MQLSVKRKPNQPGAGFPGQAGSNHSRASRRATLAELREGEQAVLESLHMEEGIARRLMELGFLPGQTVSAARSAPGGDPRVFRVDGSEVALRRETALQLQVKLND